MAFEKIQSNKTNHKILIEDVNGKKIPHAQLFYGDLQSGVLSSAIDYAKYIFCSNKKNNLSCGHCSNCKKMDLLIHPDLHFSFPVSSPPKNAISLDYLDAWRSLILKSTYSSFDDWDNVVSDTNKKLIINKFEVDKINSLLQKKSYQGDYKIFIIWLAEKLNKEASNKLLKNLEEPPEKTIFILISNEKEKLLDTILSRLRILKFNSPVDDGHAYYNKYNEGFKKNFTDWMRFCFFVIKQKKIIELTEWIEVLAKTKKDNQVNFLRFSISCFRNAFLYKYNLKEPLSLVEGFNDFSFTKFSKFVDRDNIFEIFHHLNRSIYYINRNGNTKLILMDLSINLSKLLNKYKNEN